MAAKAKASPKKATAKRGGRKAIKDGRATLPRVKKLIKRVNGQVGTKAMCRQGGCTLWPAYGGNVKGYCRRHGGGKTCKFPDCEFMVAPGKDSEFCRTHGGGLRCIEPACTRTAAKWIGNAPRKPLCIAHGGGPRCQAPGCEKGAVWAKGDRTFTYCVGHGGGQRCAKIGCLSSALNFGNKMWCGSHGGGRKCDVGRCRSLLGYPTPHNGYKCLAHGGGRRCPYPGCKNSAISLRGSTYCCIKHGGGRRCEVQGCSRSARTADKYCHRHGGGYRCKHPGCLRGAVGLEWCSVHGGVGRCATKGCQRLRKIGDKCKIHHEEENAPVAIADKPPPVNVKIAIRSVRDQIAKAKNKAEAKTIIQKLRKSWHPDKGGNEEVFQYCQERWRSWCAIPESKPRGRPKKDEEGLIVTNVVAV